VYHKLLANGNSELRIEKRPNNAKKTKIAAFEKALGMGEHSREL